MKSLMLAITSLRTDTDPVAVHYEVQVGEVTVIGDTAVRKTDTVQLVRIATVPDGAEPALMTPDVRLSLALQPH